MDIYNEDGVIDTDIKDLLYELGNVGLGSASIIIGSILGVRLNIGVPSVIFVNDTETNEKIAFGDKQKTAIVIELQNEMNGYIVLVVDKAFTDELLEKTMSENEDIEAIEVIQEYGNLIMAGYLKAISKYTGVRIFAKPVDVSFGTEKELFGEIMSNIRQTKCQRMICVDTSFTIKFDNGTTKDNVGRVLMFPDEETVKILAKDFVD